MKKEIIYHKGLENCLAKELPLKLQELFREELVNDHSNGIKITNSHFEKTCIESFSFRKSLKGVNFWRDVCNGYWCSSYDEEEVIDEKELFEKVMYILIKISTQTK
jgi:hypothetical protein